MESRGGRRISRGMLPLLAFHVVNEYYRSESRPPVTAGLLAANTLIYLRPGFLDNVLPSLNEVWFNPHLIVKNKDLKRFFLSAFYHIGDSHLVYNMMSLLWKGLQLETSMGSAEFASMVAALVAMSQGITLILAKSLLLFFDYERAYYYEHAVGFSGVLFAMKVILNSQSDDYTYVHGLVIPARYAAWAELVLIQIPLDNFNGTRHWSVELAFQVCSKPVLSQQRRIYGRGTVGRGQPVGRSFGPWRCRACSFDNSELLNVCEMCSAEREGNVDGSSALHSRRRRDWGLSGLWRCQACSFDNSALLITCEICGIEREGNASGASTIRQQNRRLHNPSPEELRRRRLERYGG
ncbi:hypothetical protein Syun_010768 [Stephania yunnanensis]|uniref:RanBP2-type domain-containing protein n=1 Tax=Stephania yunnanensis TaxID=152371 RepID=A0AAP0KJ86_9MAGN